MNLSQERAPVLEALNRYKAMRVVPFDVPGHKRGKGNRELTDFLGEKCLTVDVNSMKPLDNLCHPVSVIKEAEELAAEAFGAKHAFFMVNGTTSAVQSMVMSACKRGEKMIMPRNVHRSAINALILSGAIPVYVNPGVNHELGISLGMSVADVKQAILENPDAKAVLINNPTYYGICSNLKAITELAHQHNMLVLVDEAHGTHFYFGEGLPASAMSVGADMAAVSMHKSGGSLTQSSLLLVNGLSEGYVRQIINLTQTTSGSYLLISSLDISRRNLALRGRAIFEKVAQMAEYARAEINQIGGYYAYAEELINGDSIYDFDRTKLSVLTRDIGLAGIEVYDLLRDEYDIQIEFGDIGNILAYLSIGDRIMDLERLVSALSEIKRRYAKDRTGMLSQEYIRPEVILAPQEAFYAESESTRLEDSLGRICGEFVMCYPPGIPILAPGEKVTAKVLEYIQYAKEKGCFLTGTQDSHVNAIQTVKE
ncbi:aminotransferase class I/II-fold pyridoxal phosphate-dependent enzyme [Sporolactobacillus terrae]|uniref:Aminotransferase class V-fold PLP-dependent enzyme n=1 Tax=Sporolactobacillus terrae TaxID=269673 RepID=A0A410D6L8_9BACL|nr:aminotransferase class I/II-fold pyridoxal phosphate-dependent enzyme [Sporolactobacillus terrae]QAA21744.1 aminotransferase class V-fold PLP-dependent enzyme [Sporolactobacillus terrae]QAA24716.1 aminotransferase class V-fold PLP-dependent enzyme [Sporolactobacillus terrae]UAK16546.1 aminotransferase class I/II-fold pyridoxal phosphate-dependent enzyme [Sporolactobacillus terrae]BBN98013.1 arginine decarboxylase [Sporolactobacillus terrae]